MPAFRQGERPAASADRIGEWYVARMSDRQRKAHGLFLNAGARRRPHGRADHGRRAEGAGSRSRRGYRHLVLRGGGGARIPPAEARYDRTDRLRGRRRPESRRCGRSSTASLAGAASGTEWPSASVSKLRTSSWRTPMRRSRAGCSPRARRRTASMSSSPIRLISRSESPIRGQQPLPTWCTASRTSMPSSWRSAPRCSGQAATSSSSRREASLPAPVSGASGPCSSGGSGRRGSMCSAPGAMRSAGTKCCRRTSFSAVSVGTAGATAARASSSRRALASGTSARGRSASFPPPPCSILLPRTRSCVFRSATDDDRVLALVDSWPATLHGLGLNISTGPVVPFRATGLVAGKGRVPASHAPLLWMNHVRAMQVTWPLGRHKPEYIRRAGAAALLVPNRNYVLLRRFSAKEEARRLTAAPWIAAGSAVPDLGLENHLNYVHRPGGTLSEDEAWGLAALYNSRPARHLVPRRQREHPGERHRTSRHAASGPRDDPRARPAGETSGRPRGRAGCARHRRGRPSRVEGGGYWLMSKRPGKSSKPWGCRSPSTTGWRA